MHAWGRSQLVVQLRRERLEKVGQKLPRSCTTSILKDQMEYCIITIHNGE